MTMENLGSKICTYRQNQSLTQEELATRIGVTPQAVSKWERNQSLPDLALLSDLCHVLHISADLLLGIECGQITENHDSKAQDEILSSLRSSLEPLELVFGEKLVPVFMENNYTELVLKLRKQLASCGILMPLVRIKDEQRLEPDEFAILSYRKVLHRENIPEIQENTCSYIMEQMGKTVSRCYGDILNRELVKSLTDNLRIMYPAVVEGVVPEKISYGLLQDILKGISVRKNGAVYLLKIIEILDSSLRERPDLSVDQLLEIVEKELVMGEYLWE